MAEPTSLETPRTRARYAIPASAVVLLVLAVGFMAAGIAIPTLRRAPASPGGPAPSSHAAAGVSSFAEPGTGAPPAAEPAAEPAPPESLLSPALFRLGFSFFVGFAIAYALRSFFAFAIIAVGFFLLAMFGLQYAGIVDVHWGALAQRYDSFAAWLAAQTKSFPAFIGGSLPSAGAASVGLLTGFRRRA